MRELSSSSHARSTNAAHRGGMTPLAKALIALALVVPLVAYVAGTLASTGSSVPEQQGTVYVNDVEPASEGTSESPATTPKPSPSRPSPTRDNRPTPSPDDDADDNEARVVTPAPVQDEDERDDDDGDGGDDTDDADD